jgi:glycosyltransferase 2 family protein
MRFLGRLKKNLKFATSPAFRNGAVIALKILIMGACFWYVARQVSVADFVRRAHTVDLGWASLAVLFITAQIPFSTLRWCSIIDALSNGGKHVARRRVFAITAIAIFIGQVLSYAVGDAARVAMLKRTGRDWRQLAVTVVLDRGIGVIVLAAFGFVTLLFPSPLASLGGNRVVALQIFGFLVFGFAVGLMAAPQIGSLLKRWRMSLWLGKMILTTHNVLLRSRVGFSIVLFAAAIHALTICSIWCIGSALGMSFSLLDSAVLFTLIVVAALIPVSFGGWGVREAAVVAMLTSEGFAAERALFFSVCYGLTLVFGYLLGALLGWVIYSPLAPDLGINTKIGENSDLREGPMSRTKLGGY